MIKRFTLGLMLAGQLLLSGCISQYTLTEQEITERLAQKTTEIVKKNGLFNTRITFQDIEIDLGQTPNTIDLQTLAIVQVENPLLPLQTKLKLSLAAEPYYNQAEHSIYLREITIKQAQTQPNGSDSAQDKDLAKMIDTVINGLLPTLQPLLTEYFIKHPIYQLDTSDTKQAILAKMTTDIEVRAGEIVLLFN